MNKTTSTADHAPDELPVMFENRSRGAIVSIVLGVISVPVNPFLIVGVLAWAFGRNARDLARETATPDTDIRYVVSLATVGMRIGIGTTIFWGLTVLVLFLVGLGKSGLLHL